MNLAAAAGTDIPPVLCTVLLIGWLVCIVLGLWHAFLHAAAAPYGPRFGPLGLGVVLLVVWVVLC